MLGIVDLHRRARRVAGAATHALGLINFQRRFAVDHGRPDGGHRTARHHQRALAHIGDQIMVDLGRLGVLHDDRDVGLPTAIDFATGCGHVNPVRHLLVPEFIVQFVHQRLHHAGGVGARNIAVQPTLRMGDHGHRVACATDRKAAALQGFDQGRDTRLLGHHVLDVGTDREAHMPVGIVVGYVAQLAHSEQVHLALRASAYRPDLVATMRDMVQHTRTRPVVVLPVAIVLQHQRVQILFVIGYAAFNRGAHSCHVCLPVFVRNFELLSCCRVAVACSWPLPCLSRQSGHKGWYVAWKPCSGQSPVLCLQGS